MTKLRPEKKSQTFNDCNSTFAHLKCKHRNLPLNCLDLSIIIASRPTFSYAPLHACMPWNNISTPTTGSSSGLVPQSESNGDQFRRSWVQTPPWSECVDPLPLLELTLRRDKLGISKHCNLSLNYFCQKGMSWCGCFILYCIENRTVIKEPPKYIARIVTKKSSAGKYRKHTSQAQQVRSEMSRARTRCVVGI